MDPLSVAGIASGVAKLAYGCSTSLYSFISGVQSVDGNVRALYDEVQALRETAKSVETLLERPELQSLGLNNAQLWTQAHDTLRGSENSLRRLEACIPTMRTTAGESGQRNLIGRGLTQLKLNMKGEEIAKMRAQVHSHWLGMQTVISIVGVHVAGSTPIVLMNELIPRLNTIINMLQADDQRVRERAQSLDEVESVILRNNNRLAHSAQAVVDEVMSSVDDTR